MTDSQTNLYQEQHRPQFHFTALEGWINDPNGLLFIDGVYHLFFQHEEQQWGHAVSNDLLHWKQLPVAIHAWQGHQAFSGSAVIDKNNTSGLQIGAEPVLVAVYTSWGEGQCLAISHDNGNSFTRYEHNPVLRLEGDDLQSWPLSARDPMVFWNDVHETWIMALYTNPEQQAEKSGAGITFFTSTNLIDWHRSCHVPGWYVCPDLLRLAIEEETSSHAWVLMDWQHYRICDADAIIEGQFQELSEQRLLDVGNLSANQTWKQLPDGRVIQISWLRYGVFPDMPFDQQLSVPVELSLRRVNKKLYLCKNPIAELDLLRSNKQQFSDVELIQDASVYIEAESHCLDIEARLSLEQGAEIEIRLAEHVVDFGVNYLRYGDTEAYLPEHQALTNIRMLVDRGSIEVFLNDGLLTFAQGVTFSSDLEQVRLTGVKGSSRIHAVNAYTMASTWEASD